MIIHGPVENDGAHDGPEAGGVCIPEPRTSAGSEETPSLSSSSALLAQTNARVLETEAEEAAAAVVVALLAWNAAALRAGELAVRARAARASANTEAARIVRKQRNLR